MMPPERLLATNEMPLSKGCRRMATTVVRTALLAIAMLSSSHASADIPIRYPNLPAQQDTKQAYMLTLLRLACDKAGETCQLRPGPAMEQGRAIQELQRQRHRVNVMWTMTDREREKKLLPIRIPLFKGLIGWRLVLLPTGKADLLKSVYTVRDLYDKVAGQGHDWPDTYILRTAGLPVETSIGYEALFGMLRHGRFDYFPRSILEVEDEIRLYGGNDQLYLDPYLVIRYPTAFYFFVSPHQPELAVLLQRGLELAVADGSFEQLFQRHFGNTLKRLHLNRRRIIDLPNPLLPAATPLSRPELWYSAH